MRIARYLFEGETRYGIVEGERLRPCDGDPFAGLTGSDSLVKLSAVRLLAPVAPPNIICLGLNYRRHSEETGLPLPSEPLIFMKATTSLSGPYDPIVLPAYRPDRIDYEAELAIVIGRRAKNITEEQAADFILGYTVANDVTNRKAQSTDGQWVRAKSYDTFCPLGPVIVTDLDADNLDISSRVDGQVMQSSNTSDMIFPCRRVVSYLSRCMTLLPGTVILTGTPEGVGFTRNPPVYLRAGQILETEIEGIGTLVNTVVAG